MTKSEFVSLVNAYGAKNLAVIEFDNTLIIEFTTDDFDTSWVKTMGGVDVIELPKMRFKNKETGRYDIDTLTVHPIDMVQCLGFVKNYEDKKNVTLRSFNMLNG